MIYKDIEYERDGVRKFAQERFKEDLIAVGWKVVGEKEEAKETKDVLDRDKLKEEALALDIHFPTNIKTEKLYELIYEEKAK